MKYLESPAIPRNQLLKSGGPIHSRQLTVFFWMVIFQSIDGGAQISTVGAFKAIEKHYTLNKRPIDVLGWMILSQLPENFQGGLRDFQVMLFLAMLSNIPDQLVTTAGLNTRHKSEGGIERKMNFWQGGHVRELITIAQVNGGPSKCEETEIR